MQGDIKPTRCSKCGLKIKTGKTRTRIKKSSNKKWFDKECRLKRHELRNLANKKHRDPLNPIIREQYNDTLMQYKKLLISNNYVDLARAKSKALVNNTCKQKKFNRVMLNGDDNENGFKLAKNCKCSTLFCLSLVFCTTLLLFFLSKSPGGQVISFPVEP